MSKYGETMDKANTKSDKTKGASDFMKLVPEHPSVIRVIDEQPTVSWSHFIPKAHNAFPKANEGKGMSVTCPGMSVCPVCKWNAAQKAINPKTTNLLKASRKYSFNVLDRTPVVTCPKCATEHYENKVFPDACTCGTDLTSCTPKPRNAIVIFQKGSKVIEQFKAFEQDADFGDVRNYDIKLSTTKGALVTDVTTTCVPRAPQAIDFVKTLGADWETKKHDIKAVVTPLKPEQIERILNGEGYLSVVGAKQQ